MTEFELHVEIQQILKAAESVPGFVFLPRGADPEVVSALESFAARTGRQILPAPSESYVEKIVGEAARCGVPEIPAADDRAFIENLDAIARGKIRVRNET